MAVGLCTLDGTGSVDEHLHSFEESFYVLEGSPVLVLDGRAYALRPGACGVVPVGVPHAWLGAGDGPRAGSTCARRSRGSTAPARRTRSSSDRRPTIEPAPLDVRDPRTRNLFRLDDGQMDLDRLKAGAAVDEPTVSASMATALLAYSGIAVKMLVDQRLDAQLHTMFMVEYQPGGVAHPHDHPLEEAYVILEGEVEAVRRRRAVHAAAPATSSGPASAACTPSTTAPTDACAGSRPSRRSRRPGTPTASTATGSTSRPASDR